MAEAASPPPTHAASEGGGAGRSRLIEAREALARLVQLYAVMPEEERRRLLEELSSLVERLQAEMQARQYLQQMRAKQAAPKKRGFLARIREAVRRYQEQMLASSLPQLAQATPELPSEVIAMYLDLFQGGYNPVEEAAIRQLFAELKVSNPPAYNKLVKLLSAGPPWSLWAVAVVDRVANSRANIPINLAKLWAEFTAYSHRDIYFIIERLRQLGRPDLADRVWELFIEAESGNKQARQLLEQVKKIVYEIPPKPTSFTIFGPEKLPYIERLLAQQGQEQQVTA